MEENPNEKKELKQAVKHSKFSDYKGEFAKIVWPSKSELGKQTVTVIATCILFAIIIFVMDMVFNYGIDIFARLVG